MLTTSFRERVRNSPCWIWPGHKDKHGYGRKIIQKKTKLIHRHIWEALMGKVPEGLVLDHLCRNTSCVNPYHLEPVTTLVNNNRGAGNGGVFHLLKTECIRGHPLIPENVKVKISKARNLKRECLLCRKIRSDARAIKLKNNL